MLRSIVAVWCLALALIVIAATAGCVHDDCGVVTPTALPDMSLPANPAACATTCATACGAGEFCYQPSAIAQLPAFCARQCTDDRDCTSGEKCAALFAAQQPAICISAGKPVGCAAPSPTWHCDFPPATCKDANTAEVPFSDTADRVCGVAIVHCANGCVTGACR